MKEQLIRYLTKNGKNNTWSEIGSMFNMSGEAARSIWKRYNKKNTRARSISTVLFNPKRVGSIIYEPETLKSESRTTKSNRYTKDGMYIVLPCVHVPFHNKEFWNAMLGFVQIYHDDIAGVVILGDFLDMNSLSAYDRGKMPKKGISLGYEYSQGKEVIRDFEHRLGVLPKKVFLYGNHEDRYIRYMQSPDSKKLEGALMSPEEALQLEKNNWDVYTDWMNDSIFIGDIELSHGSVVSRHVTSKYIDNFHCNSIFCHTHRIQSFYEGGLKSFNIGSMADFSSQGFNYASKKMKKDWRNGFAVVILNNNQTHVDQIVWNNTNKCFYYGGRRYS